MPDRDHNIGAGAADAALYPAGHLAGLSPEELRAERERQWAAEAQALFDWDIDAAERAAARACACQTEIIRRGLIAMGAEEETP